MTACKCICSFVSVSFTVYLLYLRVCKIAAISKWLFLCFSIFHFYDNLVAIDIWTCRTARNSCFTIFSETRFIENSFSGISKRFIEQYLFGPRFGAWVSWRLLFCLVLWPFKQMPSHASELDNNGGDSI